MEALYKTIGYMSLCVMVLCLSADFVAFTSNTALASENYWSGIGKNIAGHIDTAQALYDSGDAKAAKRAVIQAYFGEFEDKKMEAAMRMELGAKHTYQVERLFGDLRKAITKGADQATIATVATAIRNAIERDAIALDAAGIPPEVFRVNQ